MSLGDYSAPPNITSLDTILPNKLLLTMGEGPIVISACVAAANSVVINHLGDTMSEIIEPVKAMSSYDFKTQSDHILDVAGAGSVAMEMILANMVVYGSKVLSIYNDFSARDWLKWHSGLVPMLYF